MENKELTPVQNQLQDTGDYLPPVPQNLWDKYGDRLQSYSEKKKEIQGFIKENLTDKVDYGYTQKGAKKKTLMKSGSEKILDLMECKIKIYPDVKTWEMLGKKPGSVCYVGYIVDQNILQMAIPFILKVGMQYEQHIIKLLAWGEGRGACEIDEKVYSSSGDPKLAGKPLKGAHNRSIKMAEKRCIVDAVIRTYGLEFTQDEDYGTTGAVKDSFVSQPKSVKKKEDNFSKLPEENQAVFKSVMGLINTRHNKQSVFTNAEKTKQVSGVSAISRNLEKLMAFHDSLQDIVKQRTGT